MQVFRALRVSFDRQSSIMADQLDFFDSPTVLPEGFRYQRDIISKEAEEALLAQIRELPFREFEFHGYVGKRRTVSFGYRYDFATEQLQAGVEMPPFLVELRKAAAGFSGIPADAMKQVLVTEYDVNAGIGWHRDKAVFGEVIGISLLSTCRFRLRRKAGGWERVNLDAEPRSAYLLSGPSRTEWEHSIPEVEALRYSVTFRTLRSNR
jgi:alkylated DNA repair dioxygenase AlkB